MAYQRREPQARAAPTGARPALTPRPRIPGLPACHGATPEIAPARIAAAAALHGLPLRPLRRVLLLDCGTGDGLALLAAALAGTGAEILGQSAEPEEAEAARALLAAAEAPARLIEGPAETLAARPDLPELDLVALPHGWDRLSAPDRAGLAALLAARLAPGGAFLLRRETLPGAATDIAMRALLRECWTRAAGAGPDPAPRRDAALELARRTLRQSHLLVRMAPEWDEALDRIAALPATVARRDWFAPRGPCWSARELAAALAPAGLTLRAPAEFAAAAPGLDRAPEQAALLAAAAADGPAASAEAEAAILGRRTALEIWARPGGAPQDPGATLWSRTAYPWDPPIEAPGLADRVTLDADAFAPLHAALEAGPAPLAELAAAAGLAEAEAAGRAAALAAAGLIAPAAALDPPAAARAASSRLNLHLCALAGGRPEAFAAPVLGAATPLPRAGDPRPAARRLDALDAAGAASALAESTLGAALRKG